VSQTVSEDVAAVVVQDLRAGQVPSGDLCRVLKTYPLLDDIREEIQLDDWPAVRELCEPKNGDVCRLGFGLTSEFSDQPEARRYLKQMWERDDLPSGVRYELLSRLCDSPDLPQEMHEELFAFIQNDWDGWLAAVEQWIGDRGDVLDHCKSRVADPRYPESKTWVYLCCVLVSDDAAAALEWVAPHEEDDDPFTEKVAKEVSGRLEASLQQ